MTEKRILLGKITKAHGIKGLVKILPLNEDFGLPKGAFYTSEDGPETLFITLKNRLGKYWLAEIEGVTDRTKAEALEGQALYVSRETLQKDMKNQGGYTPSLTGLSVLDMAGNSIGTVLSVQNFGASDLLEIGPESGGESFYLPLTPERVPEITDHVIIQDYEDFMA